MNNYKKYNNGFTLIEIMVTVAIVGIMASIALPSFSRLIESNRVNTATNELISNLLLAKSEALKRSSSVTLCPSSNQTTCNGNTDFSTGWIIFLDCGAVGRIDGEVIGCGNKDEEDIIKVGDSLDSVYMTNRTLNQITFRYTGRPAGISTFDIGKDSSNKTKEVAINLVGRVRASDQ